MKFVNKMGTRIVSLFVIASVLICCPVIIVQAKDSTIQVSGTKYTFGEKDNYDIENAGKQSALTNGTEYGVFSISGDIKEASANNGFKAYDVNTGNIVFSYKVKSKLKDAEEDKWHLVDDKTKKIAGIETEKNILSGVVI